MNVFELYDIVRGIDEQLKFQITLFYVFDDKIGSNLVFKTANGLIYVKGYNDKGVLGLGHDQNVDEPQVIPELIDQPIIEFKHGGTFCLAVTADKQIYSWGANDKGQLGWIHQDSSTIFHKPNKVKLDENVEFDQICCGLSHSLLLTSGGEVFGWGDNQFGQVAFLPDQLFIGNPKPIRLTNIKRIFCANNQSFAIDKYGMVYSWGRNDNCVLGHPSTIENIYQPKIIPNLVNVTDVCSANNCTYFIDKDTNLYSFGNGQFEIKLLDKHIETNSLSLVIKRNESENCCLANNKTNCYVIKQDTISKVTFEHFNYYIAINYQITLNSIAIEYVTICDESVQNNPVVMETKFLNKFHITKLIPKLKTQVTLFHVFKDTYGNNIIFKVDNDTMYGLGANLAGTLGLGHSLAQQIPQIIEELSNQGIQKIFAHATTMAAVNDKGQLFEWGTLYYRQMIEQADRVLFKPRLVTFPENELVENVCFSTTYTIALTINGNLYGWGLNNLGQIGCVNPNTLVEIPSRIDVTGIKSIKMVLNINYALSKSGKVYRWGGNYQDGRAVAITTPTLVENVDNVEQIAVTIFCAYYFIKDKLYYSNIYHSRDLALLSKDIKFKSFVPYLYPTTDIDYRFFAKGQDDIIYLILGGKAIVTKYQDYFHLYATEYQITYKTVAINNDPANSYESAVNQLHMMLLSGRMKQLSIGNSPRLHIDYELSPTGILIPKLTRSELPINFVVSKVVGSGRFGPVYKVKDKFDGRTYSIKIVKAETSETTDENQQGDPQDITLERLRKKINLWKLSTDEVNIKTLGYCNMLRDDQLYMFYKMESYDHTLYNIDSWKDLILGNEHGQLARYLFSLEIFKQMLLCVRQLHIPHGQIHSDIKPDNFFVIFDDEDKFRLKLGDLGLTTIFDNDQEQNGSERPGEKTIDTIKFIAPEVKQGQLSIEADLFSIAKTFQFVLGQIFPQRYMESETNIKVKENENDRLINDLIELVENIALSLTNEEADKRPNNFECMVNLNMILHFIRFIFTTPSEQLAKHYSNDIEQMFWAIVYQIEYLSAPNLRIMRKTFQSVANKAIRHLHIESDEMFQYFINYLMVNHQDDIFRFFYQTETSGRDHVNFLTKLLDEQHFNDNFNNSYLKDIFHLDESIKSDHKPHLYTAFYRIMEKLIITKGGLIFSLILPEVKSGLEKIWNNLKQDKLGYPKNYKDQFDSYVGKFEILTDSVFGLKVTHYNDKEFYYVDGWPGSLSLAGIEQVETDETRDLTSSINQGQHILMIP